MKFKSFQEIIAWKKAKILTLEIYRVFNKCKDYGFRDQIQRASISIMNNIAEGNGFSDKKFSQYVDIARGSSHEVQSMLIIARELDYIDPVKFNELNAMADEISKISTGLIKSLSRSNNSVD
jgi:four helix bundle protein